MCIRDRYKKIPFPALADVCAFGLLIGQIAGRWGNFMNVEAYGGPTDLPWRMGIEVGGEYMEVHPTFLYESLWKMCIRDSRNGNGIFLPHLKYWNVQLLSYHLQLLDSSWTIEITGS